MPPVKLPRATLEQKIQILDFYHQSNRPQSETVDRYKNEISISTSSFSEWLKNEDELRERLNQAGSSFSKNSRRKVKFKYEEINHAMDLLVKQKLERHEPINEPILREYWSIYAHQFGVDDPKRLVGFSHGWLSQFKKRHGLNKKRMSGNASSTNTSSSNSSNNLPSNSNTRNTPNADDVYDPNFANSGTNVTSSANAAIVSTNNNTESNQNGAIPNGSPNPDDFNAPSTTPTNSYDLMNPQATTNTQGNQFRPQQGLNFSNGSSNINFSNYELYQQQQQQQQQQQGQSHYPNPTHKDTNSSNPNPNSYDYQSQLRAHYEKQKQQYEQQQQNARNQRLTRSSARSHLTRPANIPASGSKTSSIQPEPETGSNISASDIERFIYMFADRFFHDHQYEYPQTVKVFQEFKNSFFNERIINIRSIQQQQQQHLIQQAATVDPQVQLQTRKQAQQHQAQQIQVAATQQQQQISGIDDFFLRAAAVASQQTAHDASNANGPNDPLNGNIGRSPRGVAVLSNNVNGVSASVSNNNKRWKSDKNSLS